MSPKGCLLRWTATMLVLFLAAGPLPHAASSGSEARLSGVVSSRAGASPLAGVRVHVVNAATEKAAVSGPSDAHGAFSLGNLAPGRYYVAVESRGGLYTVASPIVLAPGQARSVNLQVEPKPQQPAAGSEPAKKNVWSNPLYASLLVVGVAVVAGVIIQQTTSSSNPPVVSPTNP